ncbi:MAG TPA: hypothetical protein PLH94_13165, partial [Fimbriimonadaceae bacterium]|nr:hypothetical protein [Fimbriimonadaceae bacterium]
PTSPMPGTSHPGIREVSPMLFTNRNQGGISKVPVLTDLPDAGHKPSRNQGGISKVPVFTDLPDADTRRYPVVGDDFLTPLNQYCVEILKSCVTMPAFPGDLPRKGGPICIGT